MTIKNNDSIEKRIEMLEKKYKDCIKKLDSKNNEILKLKDEINNLSMSVNELKNKKKFSLKNIVDRFIPVNSKARMILRLATYMLLHPIRAVSLVCKIKKFNMHFGDHVADIMYLQNGNLNFKKEEKPMVSIIIPVYNQLTYTYKCLKSILKHTKDVSYEIIIADDVSSDGTKVLSKYVNGIKIVRNKKNYGFLKNCNNASNYAKGKYILFLNNDTKVTENWLSSLVELIERDNTIGMVGSKLVYPDGRLQEAGGVIFNNGLGCNYGKFDDPSKPEYNYVRDVDYISGASIMISKELWEKIGKFDERYAPAYCEDSDLAFEVRNAGYRVVYQPKSVVIHFEGISNGTDVTSTSGLKHYQIVNNEKLRKKWAKEIKKLPAKNSDRMDFSFRDRINDKKVVLVIDHYVPEFDKDAGSRTTFQYLKMFVEQGYTVKFLGDNFNNSKPYTEILQQMGIEVLYGLEYRNNIEDWLILNSSNIDFIYLNRPHIATKYIDFLKKNTKSKIIYYGHDLHYLREKREYELTKDEYHNGESEKWKTIEFDIMKKSDVVYYPSYIEENEIKKIDKSINVKAINAYIFDNVDINKNNKFNDKEGIMFVGGFGHRPNVDGVLWFAKNVYPLIRKKINIPFYIVGSNPTNEIKNLQGNGIIVKGYVTDEELEGLYNTCKVVVAPLRYGAGIKGKVVESMCKGVPLVTTSIGAEGIKDAEKILKISDTPESFAESVIELYSNEKELMKISKEMKLYISNNYSSKAAWKIIEKDFK